MATRPFRATMDEILTNVRRFLWNFSDSIGIPSDFVRVGILQQTPLMPAIAVLPTRIQIMKRYSGALYQLGKAVEIHIFDMGSTSEAALTKVRQLVNRIRRRVQNDLQYFAKDNFDKSGAFSFEWGQVIYPDRVLELQGQLARQAILPLTFFTKQERPAQVSKPRKQFEVTDDNAVRRVHDALWKARRGRLDFVKEFRLSGDPPRQNGLTIGTSLQASNAIRYASGDDSVDLTVTTTVWSKLTTDEQSLLGNVRATETISEIFERDETFGGAFWNSELVAVEYDQRVEKDLAKFESRVILTCRKFQETRQGIR